MMFEEAYQRFWESQVKGASGQRLEMLHRDLSGTKKMLEVVHWPILKTFAGLVLEYEMSSSTGVRIYGDVFQPDIETVYEAEGFVSHAEAITRDRFDFEKMRIRTFANYNYGFFPFSWDELTKKPEACRRSMYELLGRYGNVDGIELMELPVNEREVLRCFMFVTRPFGLEDVSHCLQLHSNTCRRLLRNMLVKGLIESVGEGEQRIHFYKLSEKGKSLVRRMGGKV
jgi:DNA-binding MarR family transcriptional regulator